MDDVNHKHLLIEILSILYFISLTITSCHQQERFDKTKWLEAGDLMSFPNRSCMVDDLIKNYDFKERSLKYVVNLLGQPQYALDSTMEIGYKIEEHFANDIDPIYIKTLFIHFDSDTTVSRVRLKEWKK